MTAEIERLIADVNNAAELRREIGAAGDIAALAALLRTRGYAITDGDIRAYLAARATELGEQQLDAVAAGGQFGIKVTNDSGDQPSGSVLVFQKPATDDPMAAWHNLFGKA